MATPVLNISEIVASQNQKEVTANTAFELLEAALCKANAVAMTDADYNVLNTDAVKYMAFIFSGTLTATRNIVIPKTNAASGTLSKLYFIVNTTGQTLNIKTSTQASGIPTVAAGACKLVYCDGTIVYG